jgi:hypothetical protein
MTETSGITRISRERIFVSNVSVIGPLGSVFLSVQAEPGNQQHRLRGARKA